MNREPCPRCGREVTADAADRARHWMGLPPAKAAKVDGLMGGFFLHGHAAYCVCGCRELAHDRQAVTP